MSSPDLGPTDSVQRAANLVARILERGGSLADLAIVYPAQFGSLSAADRREAIRYGRQAATFSDYVGRAAEDRAVSAARGFAQLPGPFGNWDVTVVFRSTDETGRTSVEYRTVIISGSPDQTLAGLRQTALEEAYGQSDAPEGESEILDYRYLPFDMERSF